ncbi:enoyl-CoA hydratase-related protein [Metabacillus idriensis]|uniref:Enoyl-CoA hydratase n=1 Tax=Metabacillus idriensis TaxID=324768 RepID=A0A6I2M3G3_9BACI|nr:enoyl-CoA hydratase-related protein [Metabacillus idriensis]MCM3595356.1 enoyl-CoA hydratase-related protein [Metabacillus idriensis]MRX52618.1 enoyl-CoA hydratase [Metabacillus idriensis]
MTNILYTVEKHLAVVMLNRPEVFNCFNYETLLELEAAVEDIRTNPEVRAVIFTGAGEKAFCAGADLKERKTLTDQQVKRNLYKIGEVFTKIDALPQPTIAAINGYAFGGGMELALSCDFRLIAEGTSVGLTETGLGIIPGAGGTQRLPRIIGEAKALELILTARKITSVQALEYGLVSKTAPDVMAAAIELAEEMLKNGPIALQQAKFSIKQGMNADLQTGLHIERKAYEITIPTEDRLEALAAFSEKRKPVFKGK